MLEYIFFHKLSLDQFIEQLEQRSIPCEVRDDEMGLVAAVADDLDEALIEQVDEIYEALMDSTRKLFDDDEKANEIHGAAIGITLKNGNSVDVRVSPELLNRVLTAISYEELNELVEAIVEGVENPDHRPFCQR